MTYRTGSCAAGGCALLGLSLDDAPYGGGVRCSGFRPMTHPTGSCAAGRCALVGVSADDATYGGL